MIAISNLNTYNFIFIMVGLLLHWRPRRFLDAVKKAVPATAGVLIQFPFYGGIAAILTQPKNGAGLTVSRPDRPRLRQPDHAAHLSRWPSGSIRRCSAFSCRRAAASGCWRRPI